MTSSDNNMHLLEMSMVEMASKLDSLDERVKEIENKGKIQKNVLSIISLVFSIISILLTIFINSDKILDNHVNSKYKKFIENYSEAYTKVVNNYVNGNGDFSPLEDYVAGTENGIALKKTIINNINKNMEKGVYQKNVNYKFEFKYSHYESMKENGKKNLIYISGVTYESSNGTLDTPDNNTRIYAVVKDKKGIKIEKYYAE